MRYAGIEQFEVCNGKGCGVSLFVQGCPHHCKGCFNPMTWDFTGGKEFTADTMAELVSLCNREYIDRLTVLGGEPLAPGNFITVRDILYTIKAFSRPDLKIWIYTGYRIDELSLQQLECVSFADVLVDGRFVEEEKDLTIPFRGSRNQRLINVKETFLRTNDTSNPVLYQ